MRFKKDTKRCAEFANFFIGDKVAKMFILGWELEVDLGGWFVVKARSMFQVAAESSDHLTQFPRSDTKEARKSLLNELIKLNSEGFLPLLSF